MERRDVIRGYATALFQVAQAEDALDRVSDELFQFSKAMESNHELRTALTDISLPAERKLAAVSEVLGPQASKHTANVLGFVVSQGHARDLPQIVESLTELASEAKNKVVGEARAAVALSEDQQRKLSEALSKATGRSVDLKVVVDPRVIGGVYVKVGDLVIDGTVQRRLQDLKERLEAQG